MDKNFDPGDFASKAGVPNAHVRVTSLAIVRAPRLRRKSSMPRDETLFELQERLGHATPTATHTLCEKSRRAKLAKSYADAGYFDGNLRAIGILGAQEWAERRVPNEPWKIYDLGHGLLPRRDFFFDQCPNRIACAKCSFYPTKRFDESATSRS